MIRSANFWFGLVVGAFLTVGIVSHAGPVWEIGAGLSKYHAREDGIWWQSNAQVETHNDLNSKGYQLGARWTNFRIAYVDLGHFHANNTFVGDGAVDHFPFQCPNVPEDCRFSGRISGHAYGLSFGPRIERTFYGWRAELEGGGYLFRSYQKTDVCPIDGQDFEPCHSYNRMWGVHKTWYVGAGLGRGDWSINYRAYHNVYEQGTHQGGDVGLTGGMTQTLFLTYAF